MNQEKTKKKKIYISGREVPGKVSEKTVSSPPQVVNYQVGEIVKMKKLHPCGSREWEILRTGTDFKLRCMGCGHEIMMSRHNFEKSARK